jgi:hypothetical protein
LNDGTATSCGQVRVFRFTESSWVQLGGDIDGAAASDKFGISIALSADGHIVAAGAPENDNAGVNAGHVRILQYSGGSWVQLGGDIDGEAAGDQFGWSVAISGDGSILSAGGYLNDGTAVDAGHARVYQYNGAAWVQYGGDIDGGQQDDKFGCAVALSTDGRIVAVGGYEIGPGHARIMLGRC